MSEFKLVPARMLLDKETIGAINFHCGDGADGQFGEYSDGLLWVGIVTDDDGNEVYGLHLATAEYPEEGSTTLAEFAPPPEISKLEQLTAERDALQQRLNATDQRNDAMAELMQGLIDNPYRLSNNYLGRMAAALNPTVVPEASADPFTEQFIEDHLGKMPDQLRDAAKMIGIERMPPMEYDEP